MLRKRIWIPILSVLVIAMGYGLFSGHKVRTPEPVKVYKPVEVQQPATPKPPPPGETAESGHWHGDVWHTQPHAADTPSAPVESEAPRRTGVSPGAPAVSKDVPPHVSTTPEAASGRTLDRQTQLKIDKLYAEVDRLSAESTMWSNKLYAESQQLQKEIAANKAEIAKAREMLSDPNVDKATYNAFQDALDARLNATNAKAQAINDRYLENRERHEEYMRLIKEARALGGTR